MGLMGWEELLGQSSGRLVAPWLGGRRAYRSFRVWRIRGNLPREFGWYSWRTEGRTAWVVEQVEPDLDYWDGEGTRRGYLVGDRFVREDARVDPDPDRLIQQTEPAYLVEPGLDRFVLVQCGYAHTKEGLVYMQELFPLGPESEVRRAFIDRKESIDNIPNVTPALDLAFRFATRQRQLLEERRAELERIREEERRREEAMRNMGTGLGRRTMAVQDFDAAARAALAVGNAELLDVRDGRTRREAVVQFRLEGRRFECVAERGTLRIVDSGICLVDHHTDEKGDTYFTLESLPGVIRQAIREHKLVVYRHVDDYDDWED